MDSKVKTYIGFAIKSKKCIFGYDAVMKSTKVFAVLCSVGTSEKQLKRLKDYLDDFSIPYREVSPEDMYSYVSREGVKVIGITDVNLATAVLDRLPTCDGDSQ